MCKVFDDVKRLTEKYINIWWEADSSFTCLDIKYTDKQKSNKEKELDICMDIFFSKLENMPTEENNKIIWQNELKILIKDEAIKNLNIDNPRLEKIIIDGFMDVTEIFMDKVKKYDEKVKLIDIMQAMRNVWIMNLIQAIADRKIEYSPSIFAYSMLYPYTDNFLDDPNVQNSRKKEFNIRLGKRIEGIDIIHKNAHEKKIFGLIKMIEEQYGRKEFPEVYESILSIHTSQIKSLAQQNRMTSPYEKDILSISAEKGGTSVLADAYLACGNLDDKLTDLMFGFGFILQLIDDIQDVKEDLLNNHMTIFSQTAQGFKLDSITNKLLSFTLNTLDFENSSVSPYKSDIKDLILNNCILMIFEAISKNSIYYSKEYIKNIQKHSPISFRYFIKTNKKIKKRMKSFYIL